MSHTHKIDDIDKKILEILQSRAKITNAKLSEEIGLSPAPTLERVKKLEQMGIITSYHAKLNIEKIGLGVTTFVLATLNGHNRVNIEGFVTEIKKIPEVVECHHITGAGDFILKVVAKNIASYQKLMLEKISDIKQVDNMQSMVVLSTFKDSNVIPVK
ncbi:MAG: Lrp/AsnC family transcriptional regulator [Cyclobacteriaceae bacterium]|nr:Lrp/AsnC family transcriptional regulator [Cyclobacteriaceae bacterium]MCK5280313.1 Lrp/AsnC family transcriptional regulator [Cyclobacteriaceae bacterium]MCK5370900.1 Lrp/AsnC family transcriptional regulator [Cyclobacteriaceae bacterium]MCK5701893.1 Lrp/AsnC family transcriptional regulator [Cyclobacteriaceae bacterium]